MSNWYHTMVDGTDFSINCQQLSLLKKACCWQLIQNLAPSAIVWRQCDIRTDTVLSCNSTSINGTGYYDANIFSYFFLFSRPFFTSLGVFPYYGAFYGSYFYLTNPEITSASVKRKSISSKPIDQLNLLTWMTNIKKPKFKSFILNSFNDLTSS